MFERFTPEARATVVRAQTEARDLRSERIGTEHLLLALLRQGTPTAAVLGRHGLSPETVTAAVTGLTDDLDADALGTLGIDLDAVRERVESAFGPGALDDRPSGRRRGGHIPFSPRAKKVLELSLRETIAMRQRTITDGHIALSLIREGQGLAMRVVADRGIDGRQLAGEIRVALLS
ncbi:Clp protease N-terminal domain-containing protein [Blastococcus sp. TF02A-26]|uniref:Clp protease N-terminal domain-containing protein n=1 Tax=Blastococcus sp. TF02A-26 TaxID=2250577 RepID=UPI000DEA7DBD|nr:Clp protease N-terminal domain-containing protein [Blastococcus sp. TF02A-26]RBY83154.1 Clp protease [Blastococcus sp. TF02A-26]